MTIDDINKLFETIRIECQKYVLDTSKTYQQSSERILNAASLLFNDAVVTRLQKSGNGKLTHLSFNKICEIIQKMHVIILESDSLADKEDDVRKLFKYYNLDPNQFLVCHEWKGNFIENIN